MLTKLILRITALSLGAGYLAVLFVLMFRLFPVPTLA